MRFEKGIFLLASVILTVTYENVFNVEGYFCTVDIVSVTEHGV